MEIKLFVQLSFAMVAMPAMVTSFGTGSAEQSPDGGSGTIKFGPPDLSNEMDSSLFVPDNVKCDACQAIAYQLWNEFTKFNDLKKFYKYDLPESELIELVENVCIGDSAWKDYGMQEINGVQRISGPGLETMDSPGVTAMGGKWPGRLRDMCESYVGELGETAIYKAFRETPNLKRSLEYYLCFGPADSIRGSCKPRKHRQAKTDL